MPQSLLVGHDVGTGGNKGVLIDVEGNLHASTFVPYPLYHPQTGWAEQEPSDWWDAVTAATRSLLRQARAQPEQVIAVGFAGQMLGLVPLTADGQPARPAISWMDSRADEQAVRLARRLGGRRLCLLLAGAVPSGKDIVSKLTWIREHEPAVYQATHRFLDVTGYLVFRATGEMGIDHTGAGGTGLLNSKTRRWSAAFARLLGIELAKLPPIRGCTEIAGRLTDEASRAMGLRPGLPVIAGMADIPAAATGSGALDQGDAHIYIGTSSWLCLSLCRPKNLGTHGIASVVSPDPNSFIMIGESETAGACLDWYARNMAGTDEWARARGDMSIFEVLDAVAARVEPGCGGLLFAPWMFGERSPVADATLRGGFVNLGLGHRREHLLRAIYEGVAYNLRWLIDVVGRAGFPCQPIRAIGGGARSDLWMQILADVTNRRVDAVENPQCAGAVGCALATAVALGAYRRYRDLKGVVRTRRSFEPDTSNCATYDRLYRTFRCLYPSWSNACRRINRPHANPVGHPPSSASKEVPQEQPSG